MNLENGTGAVSRFKFDRRQKIVMVQNFYCVQLRVSGCRVDYWSPISGSVSCKKHDKQLTFIVRVSTSTLFNSFLNHVEIEIFPIKRIG